MRRLELGRGLGAGAIWAAGLSSVALRDRGSAETTRRRLSSISASIVVVERGNFGVVQYSIQRNHVHLIVEAKGKKALASGMKSVGARFARSVNRVFSRRGPVLEGRFHHRVLRVPRDVRNALAYVLLNVRKHRVQAGYATPPVKLDDASSGRWFEGWKRPPPTRGAPGLRDVAPARTWLLTTGWRRYGLIEPSEVPGVA